MHVASNSVQRTRVLHHQVFGGKLNVNSCGVFALFINMTFFTVRRFVAFRPVRNVCQPQVFFGGKTAEFVFIFLVLLFN